MNMRTILHSDLNNFYASVECLLDPSLQGCPVVVCGKKEDRHGIVLAKNMIAKKAGVKTGMVLHEAERLCPGLKCVVAHHDLYLKYSRAVRRIYLEYTDQVEPFGIDEAWLDVTCSPKCEGDGVKIAEEIRKRVKEEIGLTVSIGVSFNKVFAKLGSDLKKPDAVSVISKENFKSIVWKLPASDLLYVGRATKEKLAKLNINTIGQLATYKKDILLNKLGKWGEVLQQYAKGQDVSPVRKYDEREELKSVGNSITFYRDIKNDDDVFALLILLSESVCSRMKRAGFRYASTVELYIISDKLERTLRQMHLSAPTNLSGDIADAAFKLFKKHFSWDKGIVRGLGVSVSGFTCEQQIAMDDMCGQREKKEKLEEAIENLRNRFGHDAVNRGIIYTDQHMLDIDIKGAPSSLSSEVATANPLQTAKY